MMVQWSGGRLWCGRSLWVPWACLHPEYFCSFGRDHQITGECWNSGGWFMGIQDWPPAEIQLNGGDTACSVRVKQVVVQVCPPAEVQLEVGDRLTPGGGAADFIQVWPPAEGQLEVGDTVGSVRVRQDVVQIRPPAEVELGRLQLLSGGRRCRQVSSTPRAASCVDC